MKNKIMKNIKTYATTQDFENNEPQPQQVEPAKIEALKSPRGGFAVVTSVNPGIAYIREIEYVAYNNPGVTSQLTPFEPAPFEPVY